MPSASAAKCTDEEKHEYRSRWATVVDAHAGGAQRPREGPVHGRRARQVHVLGHVDGIVGLGPAPHVHPAIGRHPQAISGLVGGQDQGPGHVHVHDRHHGLGVGVADHAVVGAGHDQVVDVVGDREPGVGVGGRHLGHGGQQLTDPSAVVLGCHPEAGPAGHVAGGEGEPGLEHLMRHLGGMEGRLEGERRRFGMAERPGRTSPAFFSRRLVSRASAPHTRATSRSPDTMAVAAADSRRWGIVPPMPE